MDIRYGIEVISLSLLNQCLSASGMFSFGIDTITFSLAYNTKEALKSYIEWIPEIHVNVVHYCLCKCFSDASCFYTTQLDIPWMCKHGWASRARAIMCVLHVIVRKTFTATICGVSANIIHMNYDEVRQTRSEENDDYETCTFQLMLLMLSTYYYSRLINVRYNFAPFRWFITFIFL